MKVIDETIKNPGTAVWTLEYMYMYNLDVDADGMITKSEFIAKGTDALASSGLTCVAGHNRGRGRRR